MTEQKIVCKGCVPLCPAHFAQKVEGTLMKGVLGPISVRPKEEGEDCRVCETEFNRAPLCPAHFAQATAGMLTFPDFRHTKEGETCSEQSDLHREG